MFLKFPNLSYFRKSELMQSREITLCTLAKKLVERVWFTGTLIGSKQRWQRVIYCFIIVRWSVCGLPAHRIGDRYNEGTM